MKCCSKCGNKKLIEGIKYCLNCGAEVEKDVKCHCGEKCKCNTNKSSNKDDKCVVKTRLSVELFEIF